MNRDCWGWGSRDSPQAPEGGWLGLGCRGKGEIGGRADRLQGSCGGRGVCAGSSVFPLTAASGSGVGGRRAGAPVTQCVSAPTPTPGPGPDLDECRVRSLCQHACRNTEGSYQCLCPAGYRLLPSGKNCQGELWPSRVWAGQVGASWEGLAPSSRFSTISREGGAGRGAQSTPEAHGQAARREATLQAGTTRLRGQAPKAALEVDRSSAVCPRGAHLTCLSLSLLVKWS